MIRYLLGALLALVALGEPAFAQGNAWRHDASGVSVPRRIGDMRLREERDLSNGGRHDVILQYGDDDTVVTLYVYRSAFPNAALWFERTRRAMAETVGSAGIAAEPRSFTLGGATAPNGLREEFDLPRGSPMRSTAVALAQIGEWMVKARISSRRLDRAGISSRMDELLGALTFARPVGTPLPLVVPQPCPGDARMSGRRIARPDQEAIAAAALTGIMAYAEARGSTGLAADPNGWCRADSRIPAEFVSVYRERNGASWVTLLGDAGRAVAGRRIDVPGSAGAAVFASTPSGTEIVAIYESLPDADSGTDDGLLVAVGRQRGMMSITVEPNRPDRN